MLVPKSCVLFAAGIKENKPVKSDPPILRAISLVTAKVQDLFGRVIVRFADKVPALISL